MGTSCGRWDPHCGARLQDAKVVSMLPCNKAHAPDIHGRAASTSVLTARVVGRADATGQPLLPDLLDATVLALRGSTMRIRGFEVVNGQHLCQVWEVEVQSC